MSESDAEREAMRRGPPSRPRPGARLISASSRLIWHLPVLAVALTISRPGTNSREDVTAETDPMRVATAAGVRTPALRGGPVEAPGGRGRSPRTGSPAAVPAQTTGRPIAAAAAKLADAPTAGLRTLTWPTDLDDPRIAEVLGRALHADLLDRAVAAAADFRELVVVKAPVLAHTDLQPANVLCDNAGAWLLDLEYAALAPCEWDPAKLVILARRFGDPTDVDELLDAWTGLDRDRLHRCVDAQEVLIVAWLARMAVRGTVGAVGEARHRATSLGTPAVRWHHLA
ncbi:MAG: phosphotransferase family protein [Dehalococcoidia bacterium]